MARQFSNTHVATTLASGINSSATAITPTSLSGLPSSYPYSLIIAYGTATLEVVTVTALAGSSLTVTRGQDGTLAQAHNAGDAVVHGVTARDLFEPQTHIDGVSNVHGVGSGSNVVGTATAQTLTNKTISGAANTLTNIPDSALAGIAGSKVTMPLPSATVTNNATVGGTLTVTGTTTLSGATTLTGTTTAAALNAQALTCTTFAGSGNATVAGTLAVTGTTTLGTANITTAAVSGNATVTGTLNVTGVTTLGTANITAGNITTATVSGNATVAGTLGVTGTLTGGTVNANTDAQWAGISLPRGTVGGKKFTTPGNVGVAIGTSLTDSTLRTGSVDLKTGRRYRVAFYGGLLFSNTADVTCYIVWTLKNNAGTVVETITPPPFPLAIGGPTYVFPEVVWEVEPGSDVTENYQLWGQVVKTSGTTLNWAFVQGSANHTWFRVVDFGPANRLTVG